MPPLWLRRSAPAAPAASTIPTSPSFPPLDSSSSASDSLIAIERALESESRSASAASAVAVDNRIIRDDSTSRSSRFPASFLSSLLPLSSLSARSRKDPAEVQSQNLMNLEILGDAGIVICPGFPRPNNYPNTINADSSSSPSAAINSATDNSQSILHSTFPAFYSTDIIQTPQSPTILPSITINNSNSNSTSNSNTNSITGENSFSTNTNNNTMNTMNLTKPAAMDEISSLMNTDSPMESLDSTLTSAQLLLRISILLKKKGLEEGMKQYNNNIAKNKKIPSASKEISSSQSNSNAVNDSPNALSSNFGNTSPPDQSSTVAAPVSPSSSASSDSSNSPSKGFFGRLFSPLFTSNKSKSIGIQTSLDSQESSSSNPGSNGDSSNSANSSPLPPPFYTTIHRIVIIGIHGWSLLGGLFGEPALNLSTKFCYFTQQAVIQYYSNRGIPPGQLEITCIPLFGHGRVDQRVENYYYNQLNEFKLKIEQANLIIVASHSQGSLVATQLIMKLVQNSNSSSNNNYPSISLKSQQITILSLSGLHHGPFPDIPTIIDYSSSTKELFYYNSIESDSSKRHWNSMRFLIESGVKYLFIASIHDQVVPIYSAFAQFIPQSDNILRGFYIDYQHYSPNNFLYSLISLIVYFMNINTNFNDRNQLKSISELLINISGFLKGPLLSDKGGPHSAIHRLRDVFALAVEFSLDRPGKPVINQPIQFNINSYSLLFSSSSPLLLDNEKFLYSSLNKYLIQYRMDLLLNNLIYSNLNANNELNRLKLLFSQWNPKTKYLNLLKDIIEPVFNDGNNNNIQNNQNNQYHSLEPQDNNEKEKIISKFDV